MRSITLAFTRRARLLLALPLCLATMLLLGTNKAAAAAPFAVSGTYAQTSSDVVDYVEHGCGCVAFYTQLTTTTLSGTMTGTGSYKASCQIRWRSGDGVCVGTFVFEGTIAGRTGKATYHIVTHFDATTGAVHSTMSVVSGTGGLADLHGQLDVGNDTYSGQLVFST